MRMLLAIGLTAFLSGCGISNPILKSEIVSFDDVIESATDKLLVLNILRARDQAPLHFMALPSLRQSITQNNQLSLFEPFGAKNGSAQRNTATLNMSFQVSPTFDLNHVYSKEFVTGMTTPVESKYVQYWLDRGLDRRLVMLLFFSSAEVKNGSDENAKPIRITNTPKESIDEIRNRMRKPAADECEERSQFERYLTLVNRFKTFTAKTSSSQNVAACIYSDGKDNAKLLQALAAAEQAKMKFKYVKNKNVANSGVYKLYSGSEDPQVLFCLDNKGFTLGKNAHRTEALKNAASCKEPSKPPKGDDDTDCPQNIGDATSAAETSKTDVATSKDDETPPHCPILDKDGKKIPDADLDIRFTVRSVGEMIHFLGDLLYYQEALNSDPIIREGRNTAMEKARHDLHDPVTLGYCRDETPPTPELMRGIDDILFNVSTDQANARFTVPYRDKSYAVGNFLPAASPTTRTSDACRTAHADRKDHTLEVLSVVQQLTNLHQTATEIRATPVVQVVP